MKRAELELALEASTALHRAVLEFTHRQQSEAAAHAEFTDLAHRIADFQRRFVPGVARLSREWSRRAPRGDDLAALAAVPSAALRFADVFAFPTETAALRFETSGTTSGRSGVHWFRTAHTYRQLCLAMGRPWLLGTRPRALVVALLPPPAEPPRSSLAFMALAFMEAWDGASLDGFREPARFRARDAERWLMSEQGPQLGSLRRVVELGWRLDEPVLLVAPSFALALLLESMQGTSLPLPPHSVVMPTGGFKGRTREIEPEAFREHIQRALEPHAIVYEYGMTELSSQLYEGTLPEAPRRRPPGVYLEPKTLRVIAVDPTSLEPVADGVAGLASFVDLGNVDSMVRVVTQDLVVRHEDGVHLLGRYPGAPLRGCSLAIEELVAPSSRSVRGSNGASRSVDTNLHRTKDVSALERGASRRRDAALRRIASLLHIAPRFLQANDPLGRALRERVAAQGLLSLPGIERALDCCLEVNATTRECESLFAHACPAPRVWVVLSANVFTAPLRAIALALASSDDVRVRASRRDGVLAELLHRAAPGLFRLVSDIEPEPGDHVHAYGSVPTIAAIREQLPRGTRLFAHTSGFGVAWIATAAAARGSAQRLVEDMILFDQRGCLSPRLVVLEPEVDRALWLHDLEQSLNHHEREVPIGDVTAERADLLRFRDVATLATEELLSLGQSLVAVQTDASPVLVPPVGRHLTVLAVQGGLQRLIASRSWVTTVGVAGDAVHREQANEWFPAARVVTIGQMQRPPLDGPVDLRTPRDGEPI